MKSILIILSLSLAFALQLKEPKVLFSNILWIFILLNQSAIHNVLGNVMIQNVQVSPFEKFRKIIISWKLSAICDPVCEPPRCHTTCQEPRNAVCDVKCEKPVCEVNQKKKKKKCVLILIFGSFARGTFHIAYYYFFLQIDKMPRQGLRSRRLPQMCYYLQATPLRYSLSGKVSY